MKPLGQHVAIAVVIKDNKVLMLRTEDGYIFPGGKVKPGEAEPKAALRETTEETGVIGKLKAKLGDKPHPTKEGVFLTYWLCDYKSGEAHVVEPDKHRSVDWATFDEAEQRVGDKLSPFIKNFFDEARKQPRQASTEKLELNQ